MPAIDRDALIRRGQWASPILNDLAAVLDDSGLTPAWGGLSWWSALTEFDGQSDAYVLDQALTGLWGARLTLGTVLEVTRWRHAGTALGTRGGGTDGIDVRRAMATAPWLMPADELERWRSTLIPWAMKLRRMGDGSLAGPSGTPRSEWVEAVDGVVHMATNWTSGSITPWALTAAAEAFILVDRAALQDIARRAVDVLARLQAVAVRHARARGLPMAPAFWDNLNDLAARAGATDRERGALLAAGYMNWLNDCAGLLRPSFFASPNKAPATVHLIIAHISGSQFLTNKQRRHEVLPNLEPVLTAASAVLSDPSVVAAPFGPVTLATFRGLFQEYGNPSWVKAGILSLESDLESDAPLELFSPLFRRLLAERWDDGAGMPINAFERYAKTVRAPDDLTGADYTHLSASDLRLAHAALVHTEQASTGQTPPGTPGDAGADIESDGSDTHLIDTRSITAGSPAALGSAGFAPLPPTDRAPVRRVLLWGDPGTGKTALAAVLAREAGRVALAEGEAAILPAPDGSVYEQSRKSTQADTSTRLGPQRLIRLDSLRRLAALSSSAAVMVVDEAEQVLTATEVKDSLVEFFDQCPVPEIWIANNLAGVHEAVLRRFDVVLHVPALPQDKRLALAERLLGDKDLAARVAAACTTPAAIRQAASWARTCPATATPASRWSVIAAQLAQARGAVQAARTADGADWAPQVIMPTAGGLGLAQVSGYAAVCAAVLGMARALTNPAAFARLGATTPKGLLLAGPPGVGKTHLVRSLAQEIAVPVVMAAAADLSTQPDRIGKLFQEARRLAPCLVFLDEIDVLGNDPADAMGGVSTEKQRLLNRLLVELDGFDTLDGVLVVGATHRPQRLDEALTRSGRFGRLITMRPPTREDRVSLWTAVLGRHPHEAVDVHVLARLSGGMTGADITEAANQAAARAALDGADEVGKTHLLDALDRVFWGEAFDGRTLPLEERQRTAVHEAGHLLLAWKAGLAVDRATVRPRQDALGAIHIDRGDDWPGFGSVLDVRDQVQTVLGGLLAERLVYGGAHGEGVSSDLEHVHEIARRRATKWGMGAVLGPTAVGHAEVLSDDLRARLEHEERVFVRGCVKEAAGWLADRRAVLEELAQWLLDKRDADGTELNAWRDAHHIHAAPSAWAAWGLLPDESDPDPTTPTRPAPSDPLADTAGAHWLSGPAWPARTKGWSVSKEPAGAAQPEGADPASGSEPAGLLGGPFRPAPRPPVVVAGPATVQRHPTRGGEADGRERTDRERGGDRPESSEPSSDARARADERRSDPEAKPKGA